MTEYDFSPAAYERHIATQNRVSNWVSSQSFHTRRYTSPFEPSGHQSPTPPRDRVKSPTRTSSRSRSSSVTAPARQPAVRSNASRHYETGARPPSRSQMIPSSHIIAPQPTHPIIPNSSNVIVASPNLPYDHDHHRNHHNHHNHRSSRRSSDRSPSRSRHHRSSSTSHSYTVHMPAEYDSTGRKYIQIAPDTRKQVVHIPPPRHGEQYVIIPPPGGRVEVVPPNVNNNTHHRRQSEYWGKVDREREERGRKPETTFLKRLFKGFADDSRTSSSRTSRSMSRPGHRRESSY